MVIKQVLKEAEEAMNNALNATKREFSEIRSGRANPKFVEGIRVNYYGTPTLIKDMATINVPEARMLIINPWDPGSIKEIEKAIMQADLGITPIVDGKIIRLVVPPLSEERRAELIKIVKKISEEGKVSIRTVRRDIKDKVKKLEKDKQISEDDKFKLGEKIQELTDNYTEKMDLLLSEKEKELKEF